MKHIICTDTKEIAGKVSKIFIDQVKHKTNSVLLLATGSSPILTYKCIVEDYKLNHTDWSHVITFNLDEYLDLDQRFMNQSYAYFMGEHLFNYLNIRHENIHFPNEKQMGSVFHQMVQQAGGIDLAILGIGTNGHIAFNEPGSAIDSTTRIVELKESTRLSNAKFFNNNINLVPKKAISVGLDLIRTAKRVVIIATGKDKYEAVQHLLKATKYDKEWPVTALFDHPDTLLFTGGLK